MNNIDEIYQQALAMLEKGRSKEEVLLEFAQHKNELAPLLEISSMLLLMPKNSAPEPAKRRKYMAAPVQNFWLTWVHISKFAGVSMSLMLLISAFSVAGYTALHSHPGQSLFAVKKSAEQLELLLAVSQDKKADLQIAIAQNRLSEAQEIFNNPQSGTDQKNAALNELAAQTSSAVAQVSSVAKNDPKSSANPPLLNSLDNITKQQQTLLSEIKPQDTTLDNAAQSAIKELGKNAEKISEIKQSVAVAGADQSLATLGGDPNAVAVIGSITQLDKDQITVEKTVFSVGPHSVIKNLVGDSLSYNSLSLNSKVNATGSKVGKNILAQQILVLENDSQGLVQGDSTTTTSTALSIKKVVTSTTTEDNDSATSTLSVPDPNAASGSFIIEDPAPQFAK